ncbi:hypothetical protein Agub_g7045, partial [Astrephomene gubernaculifera]
MLRQALGLKGNKGARQASVDGEAVVEPQQAPEETENSSTDELNRGVSLTRGGALRRGLNFSPWLGGDYFICISIKEAIDIPPASAMPGATCDPFVRVALQRPGALPFAEAETRVITRNSYPMWEECLPFPLDYVTEDTSVTLRMFDKDIGHFNSFVGQVSKPIPELLAGITELGQETPYRMPLQDRSGTPRKRGELVFGVSILGKQQYKEMRAVITAIQDPEQVYDQLAPYRLHLKLHGLRELGGLGGLSQGQQAAGLAVEISLCCFEARRALRCPVFGGEADPEGFEVEVPLADAFEEQRGGAAGRGRNRAQFGDIKIDLVCGKTRLAKTQIPIWDVPFRPEPAAAAAGLATAGSGSSDPLGERSSAEGAAAAEGGNATTRPGLLGNLAAIIAGGAGGCGKTVKTSAEVASSSSPDGSPRAPATPPAAPPAPLWDGKRYSRRMERIDRSLAASPVVLLSMQLVKAEGGPSAGAADDRSPRGGSSAGGAGAVDFAAVDVEAPGEGAQLAPPAPLDSVVADMVVGLGPHALCRTLFGPDSELANRVAAAEQMTDLKSGPWGPDPENKALSVRQMSYMKPTPVGPTAVQSVQKILTKCDGGFVVENRVTPNVPPIGQCVHVVMQIVGQHVGPDKTRLSASIKTQWFKSGMMVNMVKSKVDDASPKDARKYYETLRNELIAAKLSVEGASGAAGS